MSHAKKILISNPSLKADKFPYSGVFHKIIKNLIIKIGTMNCTDYLEFSYFGSSENWIFLFVKLF